MATVPTPPDARRCDAVTRKGTRCKSWALIGDSKCIAHCEEESIKSLVIRDPVAAQERGVAKKKQQREDAEQEAYIRTLNAKEQLRHRLVLKATKMVDALEEMLESDNDETRLKALRFWYENVHGRPHSTTLALTAEVPANPVIETFSQLSPDERRALLQQASQPQLPPGGSE
jgi:hypothetical protein